jgi:hypothetical protein
MKKKGQILAQKKRKEKACIERSRAGKGEQRRQ